MSLLIIILTKLMWRYFKIR